MDCRRGRPSPKGWNKEDISYCLGHRLCCSLTCRAGTDEMLTDGRGKIYYQVMGLKSSTVK